jgi:bacteriocin-like protein
MEKERSAVLELDEKDLESVSGGAQGGPTKPLDIRLDREMNTPPMGVDAGIEDSIRRPPTG